MNIFQALPNFINQNGYRTQHGGVLPRGAKPPKYKKLDDHEDIFEEIQKDDAKLVAFAKKLMVNTGLVM